MNWPTTRNIRLENVAKPRPGPRLPYPVGELPRKLGSLLRTTVVGADSGENTGVDRSGAEWAPPTPPIQKPKWISSADAKVQPQHCSGAAKCPDIASPVL